MSKRYFFPDDPENYITPSKLKKLGKAKQLEIMETWFRTYFEDPAQETPYNGREGGYQYIHGGPYEALDELSDEFGGVVPDERIAELAEELDGEGPEWAPTGAHPDRQDEGYEEQEEQPRQFDLEEMLQALEAGAVPRYGDAYELSLRQEIIGKLDGLEHALSQINEVPAGLGHNNPPEAITEAASLSAQTKQEIAQATEQLRSELSKEAPDATRAALATKTLKSIGEWLLSKADKAVDAVIDWGMPALIGAAVANVSHISAFLMNVVASAAEWLHTVLLPF
jgi:hypothetical protein